MYPVCKLLWVSGVAVPPEPVCLGMNVQVELIWRLKNWIWRQNCHGDMLWILRDTHRLNRKPKNYQSKPAKKQWVTQWKVLVNLYAWGGGDPVALTWLHHWKMGKAMEIIRWWRFMLDIFSLLDSRSEGESEVSIDRNAWFQKMGQCPEDRNKQIGCPTACYVALLPIW